LNDLNEKEMETIDLQNNIFVAKLEMLRKNDYYISFLCDPKTDFTIVSLLFSKFEKQELIRLNFNFPELSKFSNNTLILISNVSILNNGLYEFGTDVISETKFESI